MLAGATYDGAGELSYVGYGNKVALQAIGRDQAGRVTSLTWRKPGKVDIVSTVARSRAGTIIDETLDGVDARPGSPNYVYDAAGRLTQAWVTGHHYTYDYTTTTPSGCPKGTQTKAGTNTNRVRLLDKTDKGTAETGYCYDDADRLIGTTGANPVTGITYDNHGNTLTYSTGGSTTSLGWDSADRNLTASSAGGDPAKVAYTRDATDRIIRRDTTQGDTTAPTVLYGYTGNGDTADITYDTDKRLSTLTTALPGGVLLTNQNNAQSQPAPTWDYPTIRGDLALTCDNTGTQLGDLHTYTPYGEPLTTTGAVDPDNTPNNQPGQMDYGWLGQHQRPHEHTGVNRPGSDGGSLVE